MPEPVFIVPGAFLGFAAIWTAVVWIIGQVGGWSALGETFRSRDEFRGKKWRFQSGRLRYYMGYNNCVTIGADPSGLHLSLFFIFRIGHPDLFIPWEYINVTPGRTMFVETFELRFRGVPVVPLVVRRSLGGRLAAGARDSWPGPR